MSKADGSRKEFNWDQLNKICRYPLTQEDIASILDISVDTIARRIREEFDLTFAEYHNQKKSYFRKNILVKQYEVAMNGNVSMLIWLGKNYLGQKDKSDKEIEAETAMKAAQPVQLNKDQLIDLIKAARGTK